MFVTPPSENELDQIRIASLLNFIFLCISVGVVLQLVVIVFLIPERLDRLPVMAGFLFLVVGLKLLMNRGYFRLASHALVGGLWMILTGAILSSGGVYNPAFAGFVVVVIAAALLLGGRAALLFGILAILSGLVAYFVDFRSGITRLFDMPDALVVWLTYSVLIAVVSAMLSLAARSIDHALREARTTAEALRRSELHYRSLMEQAGDGIFISDMNGKFLEVNEMASAMLGYTRSELQTLNITDVLSSASVAANPIRYDELAAGQHLIMEREVKRKDGLVFPAEVSARVIEGEKLLAIVRDITARKRVAEAISESESRYRLLAENATDMISRHTSDGVFLYVSPASRSLAGYEPEELEGRSAYDFFHPDDLEAINESHTTILETPTTYTVQYRLQGKDGNYKWVETTSRTLRNPANDEVEEIISITRDISVRKQFEQQLERQLEFVTQVMNSLGQGVVVTDATHQFNYVNPAFANLLGTTIPDLAGKTLRDIAQSDERQRIEEALLQRQKGITTTNEFHLQHSDGRRIPVLVTSVPRREEGKITGSIKVITDLTEQKHAEDLIRKERDFSNAVIDSMPGILYLFDEEGKMLRWNQRFEGITGYSAQMIENMHPLEFIEEKDRALVAEKIEEVFTTGSATVEAGFLYQDGQSVPYYLTGKRINIDDRLCIVGVGIDITERKHAEHALLESEQRYRAVAENASVGIWQVDTNGHTIYVNPAMCALLQIDSVHSLQGETFHTFVTDETLEIMRAKLPKREAGESSDFEVEIVGQQGRRRNVLVSGAPILSPDGDLESLMATFVDITDRKQVEIQKLQAERLQIELEHERALNAFKDRFMATVSHEFRTPLTIINLLVYGLSQYGLTHDERQDKYHKVKIQVQHLDALLEDFSVMIRAESGRLHLQPEHFQLGPFCATIIEELAATIGDKHEIQLNNNTQDDTIMADPKLLRYVVRNLLTNAIKYSLASTEIKCTIEDRANLLMITVQDQGVGIPPEDLPHIFKAYHRASNVSKIDGTGLGLKIVKDCLNLHGGDISVESAVAEGSTFRIELPRDASQS